MVVSNFYGPDELLLFNIVASLRRTLVPFFTIVGNPSKIPKKACSLRLSAKSYSEPPHEVYYQSQKEADQYHCSYREVKLKVLFFNPDIAGQTAKPFKRIWKQIDNKADGNNCDSEENNVFACL